MDKKRILVIDDEEGFTDLVKEILEQTGRYVVETVNRGKMALFVARTFKPDLVLLDVMIPDMDGTCVADQIENDKNIGNVPIVFVSALFEHSPNITDRDCILLSKPVGVRELIDCVQKNL